MSGEEVAVKIPKPTAYRCGRCAFARMSGGKYSKNEIDLCNYGGTSKTIKSLSRCPKKMAGVFDTAEDRKKGNFEG
jgi:hypothetical protein